MTAREAQALRIYFKYVDVVFMNGRLWKKSEVILPDEVPEFPKCIVKNPHWKPLGRPRKLKYANEVILAL